VAKGDGDEESIRSAMLALSGDFITVSDDAEAALGQVTESAVNLIDGVDYADVMLSKAPNFVRGTTDPLVTHLDELQMEFK
jgi:hypothetical protein